MKIKIKIAFAIPRYPERSGYGDGCVIGWSNILMVISDDTFFTRFDRDCSKGIFGTQRIQQPSKREKKGEELGEELA